MDREKQTGWQSTTTSFAFSKTIGPTTWLILLGGYLTTYIRASYAFTSSSINMPGAAVLHTAPEVEAEPEPKKLCAPPPDPGCKVDEAKASSGSYYCGFCDKNCDHNTANCPFYDSDAEDDIYGEYKGPKEGFVWICLLGCSGSYCKLDHGKGISRGLYVRRLCDRCHEWDNCTSDCSSKPKFKGAADANMDMGEIENTRT